MARNTYGPGPYRTFKALCTSACATGDLCVVSSNGYAPASDGQQAEAYCVVGAATGQYGVFTHEEGLEVVLTGTVEALSPCYVAGPQSVDSGSQGDKHCGISHGPCPWDATKCVVALHFKAAETITHE